jgi:HYR domain/Secretion system C-terminal sorting domain
MKKTILHVFSMLTFFLLSTNIIAQSCPGANRDVSNSKSSTPNDAIGVAMKNFFADGGSATWRFEPGAKFIENTDGTAKLTGVLAYYDMPTRRFQVDINLIGQTYNAPAGSPVLFNTNPSIAGWYYYFAGPSSFTGLSDLAGAKLDFTLRGKALQLGIGGADAVADIGKLGASAWFSWNVVSQPSNPAIRINAFPANPSVDQADISITLSGNPTVCGDPCATDTQKPIISNCPGSQNLSTAGACANASWTAPTSSDNCSTPTLAFVTSPTAGLTNGGCYPIGVTTVTYTATDAKGNTSTCSFTITVTKVVNPCDNDTEKPTLINCPTDQIIIASLGQNCKVATWTAPTASDNCSTPTIVLTSSSTTATKSGDCFPVGKTTLTYTATDAKGNTSTCSFFIMVNPDPCDVDNTKPTINNCPSNQSLTADLGQNCKIATWIAPTATDNCSTPVITLSSSSTTAVKSGDCFPIGITTLTYTATDAKGNTATCSFTITVTATVDPCATDVTKPTLSTCPSNQTLTADLGQNCKIATWTAPTATDNCSTPVITLRSSSTTAVKSGDCFPIGTTTLTYTATDAKGNTATCSFTITVGANPCDLDVTKPVINNCPANQTLSTGASCVNASWTAPTATDNCSTPTLTFVSSPTGFVNGSCYPIGVTTITYTATDAKGNTATCSFTITVKSSCVQVTNPGSISGDEEFCPGAALSSILETSPATGGTGAIEYMWMYSTTTSSWGGGAGWVSVPNSNTKDLINVPAVTQTAYFIRCVRRAGCDVFDESNVVVKKAIVFAQIKGPFDACLGAEVTFEGIDAGPNVSYTWLVDDATVSISSDRIVKFKFTSVGQKRVRYEAFKFGCSQKITRFVDVKSCLLGSGAVDNFNLVVANTHAVQLDWKTSNEKLSSMYVVESSADGVNFAKVAEVPAQVKAVGIYRFMDENPKMGRSFYRIKHIENDGNITYTAKKQSVIYINGGDKVMAYPNPTNNQIFFEVLDVDNNDGVIEVYNELGNLVKSQNFAKSQVRYEVNTSELPTGIYIVKIRSANNDVKTIKISKQ